LSKKKDGAGIAGEEKTQVEKDREQFEKE